MLTKRTTRIRCEYCDGSGRVLDGYDDNGSSEYTDCRVCGGTGITGVIEKWVCDRCNGEGVVLDDHDENGAGIYLPCPDCTEESSKDE